MEVKELDLGAQLSCTVMGSVALLCTGAQWTEVGVCLLNGFRRTVASLSATPPTRQCHAVQLWPSSLPPYRPRGRQSCGAASLNRGSRVLPGPLRGLSWRSGGYRQSTLAQAGTVRALRAVMEGADRTVSRSEA